MATKKPTPIAQMKPKHSKTKMTPFDLTDFIDEETTNFNQWRDMVCETIKVQRSNVRRADMYSSILFQVANNELAKQVAHADKEKSILWAVNFTKKVAAHIEKTLDKLADIFKTFSYDKLISGGVKAAEDPLFKMVPFFTEKVTIEEIYWGDITYQTIRPYGEKLNDTVRNAYQRFCSIKEQLDDEALKRWEELDGGEK